MNAVNTSAYSMENVRICKKCLLRDLAEEDQKDLKKYLAAIKPEDRASEEVYEMRLGICRKCEKLAEAQSLQLNIYDYCPRSGGTKDYMKIAKEIMEKLEPDEEV